MGKFQNMLLLSDYDNTLRCTGAALLDGTPPPPVAPRNLEAIRHWMAEGGFFTIATGRTLEGIRRHLEEIPLNAPVIVDNGGCLYDLRAEKYLIKSLLPAGTRVHLAALMEAFPDVSLEMYQDNGPMQVMRETDWNRQHALLTGLGYQVVERSDKGPDNLPLMKALFVSEREELDRLKLYMERIGLAADYELIFSNDHLLELTARGADKGTMALRLKELCGCEKLYCAGDHANDLPMLRAADQGFAPADAIPEVLSSGATVVCSCLEGAVADIVDILEHTL